MNAPAEHAAIARQHLIDPEICIRCNTCEETCPVDAITHDNLNYVVKFEVCNGCLACVPPCPTGAIDSWRNVETSAPYTLEEQFVWDILPDTRDLDSMEASTSGAGASVETPTEVKQITEVATAGHGGPALAPWSASHPYINLYGPNNPVTATVTGNYRLTEEDASSDIHHIVLDFGATPFPVLEGQSIGIIPPGVDDKGKPHLLRMYSVASPREGERPHHNNLSLTVKRVTTDHDGNPARGVASNYVCDLKKGDKVQVTGPYGSTFLMPNHPGASIMMICTGTGSAPMRAMTERRRRRMDLKEGGELMLFFGARTPGELPYFGPLKKLPEDFIDINFAFSRVPGEPKRYVQDRIRERADKVFGMLTDDNTYIYICGLKGMEAGVIEAFRDICRAKGADWDALRPQLLTKGRFHIETY
ncbi:benzoyl-CoA 2,3-epoxidase subunit BoxA [Azoarcus communis]|uniref:Benzoyl-CoA oxygenase component A n=1 Tax=Parazoarcus communis SWub3 = DSM 12120 TaxID=1121029 RepID=A0A323UZY9_9RHOO|nr:benzoyl-CoA 2,3-epoxidase subunit BoxA [Parazoarcus communis]NMG46503.1 benzoyl-CoA 2,3-epoxidase subunit BoxA [Parazoarcus communis]NMG68852.1 benzoyl-CoA 2,3-epoxidase subunit BoxA [Parazoarcus communis SWub3 = DSM 12120]PZA16736.1 benzoyl-CoA 2,3-epoxidase subunit BoxA [Azoarcus communis] [Parazoarcus communis SWub3 = DSM 12120]